MDKNSLFIYLYIYGLYPFPDVNETFFSINWSNLCNTKNQKFTNLPVLIFATAVSDHYDQITSPSPVYWQFQMRPVNVLLSNKKKLQTIICDCSNEMNCANKAIGSFNNILKSRLVLSQK